MPELTSSQAEYLLQFYHPEKYLEWRQRWEDAVLAPLFDLDEASYRSLRGKFSERVKAAALELVSEPGFRAKVMRLPFKRGDTAVCLGGSATDDLQSWAEILKALLAEVRPGDEIGFHNFAVSGETTTCMLGRFHLTVNKRPDWIFCLPGTNDARRHGPEPSKCLVTPEEMGRNLDAMRTFAASVVPAARWVWLTPGPILEKKFSQSALARIKQVRWGNDDLERAAEVVRRQPGIVVNLGKAFGANPEEVFYQADGLHPSLAGQKKIVRVLVEQLAG